MQLIIGQDMAGYFVRAINSNGATHDLEVGIKTKKQARSIACMIADKYIEHSEDIRITDMT